MASVKASLLSLQKELDEWFKDYAKINLHNTTYERTDKNLAPKTIRHNLGLISDVSVVELK